MTMHVFYLTVTACLLTVAAASWRDNKYPNPVSNPSACGNDFSSWVCDPDDLITPAQARDIDAELKKIHALQNVCICRLCPSSMGVGVALKRRIEFTYERTKDSYQKQKEFALFSFAQDLRIFKWGFLKEGECLNSAIILVTGDGEIEFSVGRSASYTLKWECRTKTEEIGKRYISSGKYYQGIMEMLKRIRTALATKSDCDETNDSGSTSSVVVIIVSVVVIVIIVAIVCCVVIWRRRMMTANVARSQGGASYQPSSGARVVVGVPQQPHHQSGAPPPHQQSYPTAPPQVYYSAPPSQYPTAVGSGAPPSYNDVKNGF